MKIISGGQQGADRAALEAALLLGLETGGWAPKRFMTSNGSDPRLGTVFHLQELELSHIPLSRQFAIRSCKNVDMAEATIAFRLVPSVGTDKTIGYAQTKQWISGDMHVDWKRCLHRPCLIISSVSDHPLQASRIRCFLQETRATIVNVAGHRDSTPTFFEDVKTILVLALQKEFENGKE